MFEYLIIIIGISAGIVYLINRNLEIKAEIAHNKYKLERKKLYTSSKSKKQQTDDEDDEIEDFIDSLPTWLTSIAEGAKVDLSKVYEGDPDELKKVKDLLDKNLPKGSSNFNDGLIG